MSLTLFISQIKKWSPCALTILGLGTYHTIPCLTPAQVYVLWAIKAINTQPFQIEYALNYLLLDLLITVLNLGCFFSYPKLWIRAIWSVKWFQWQPSPWITWDVFNIRGTVFHPMAAIISLTLLSARPLKNEGLKWHTLKDITTVYILLKVKIGNSMA